MSISSTEDDLGNLATIFLVRIDNEYDKSKYRATLLIARINTNFAEVDAKIISLRLFDIFTSSNL